MSRKITCMTHEEWLRLIDAVLEKIPEQITRDEKMDFATGVIVALKYYNLRLGMLEPREKLKRVKATEQEIEPDLYNRILQKCEEVWDPETCACRTPEVSATETH